MTILLTAFVPFGGDRQNASLEVMKALPDRIGGTELIKLSLPVAFGRAGEMAIEAAEGLHPDAVVCLGQAGGRTEITPERVAINLMDGRIPDNDGFQPADTPIDPDGPAAFFSSLPIRAMVKAMEDSGVPARISNTAGTYVCNDLMYRTLRWAARKHPGLPCGFIHVPYLAEQEPGEGVPTLPKAAVVRAVEAALAVLEQ